ncbi:Ribosomal RNA small subunit methyltransferase B [Pseudodesulfovibrio hydrargyri]|uniref:Ribosomal RNA small subunit methyltransferase B n=1 Tax=Pseudodesulfovibrio hydrargyri TaxID=2125990 RepID=A0A1J5NDA6_9BACT|nr:transcription antitermination factor NusB [Pseudodesulfovibrio hydrargyri]OIQ49697.1 Ribosomal RNA small subunit methyltransferase B [Pseudodesulfovibrio hydrargyri]
MQAHSSKPLPSARRAALEALFRCLMNRQDIQASLDAALSTGVDDPRDVGLATELSYGYLRLKGRIEYVLSRFLQDPGKLNPKMRLAMGVAAYEILFLDKIPAYASVDWAVEFSKSKPGARLAGLFNAVLRRVSELGADAHDPDFFRKDASLPEFLSRWYACPQWLVDLWWREYGEKTATDYLEAQIKAPALGFNLFGHPDADELYTEIAGWPELIDIEGMSFALPGGTAFEGEPDPPLARQSFAARQAVEALDPEIWDGPVWDACAGRGGKTRILLEKGLDVFASDPHRGRLAALERELHGVEVFEANAATAEPPRTPGTILLDMPCSGLGVLSRRPDTKWKRKPADLSDLTLLQREILDNALAQVKPGGRIAVITCTLNPEENQGLVARFAGDNDRVSLEREWTTPSDSPLNEFFYAASLIVK